MAEHRRPDDLAALRARLAAQEARIAHLERRKRLPRRSLPLLLATFLVALIPLATLAANPFTDLTGGPHDANIDLIYNAGITIGCVPNAEYCPNGLVTREEMASFLARTAGLGTNPPIVNALTAQTAATAASATNAQNAVMAQTATNATNAQNAGNANTVGGYAADGLNRVAFARADGGGGFVPNNGVFTTVGQVTIVVPPGPAQLVHVRGETNVYIAASGGNFRTRIQEVGGPASSSGFFPYLVTDAFDGMQAWREWVFVAAPGSHTYALQLQVAPSVSGQLGTSYLYLVATMHPFGGGGGPGALEVPAGEPGETKP